MFVSKDFEPHASHKMSEWENTIVTLVETARFGSIRKCINCGAEHARTVAGQAAHEELSKPCE
jgi:hypothetical protein